jgi:hypothetical protein
MEKVPSLSAVSLSTLFFWNQLTALSEGYLYLQLSIIWEWINHHSSKL